MAEIDVLLPVRNGMPFLDEAIDSIRRQTFSDWRLLILDHGSNDGSFERAQEYAGLDRRINAFSIPNAVGLAGLLNAGLRMCDCGHILRQDADDISLPNRMEIVQEVFASNPNLLLVGGDAKVIGPSGSEIGYLRAPNYSSGMAAAGFYYNPILHPSVSFNFRALSDYDDPYGRDLLKVLPQSQSLTVTNLAEDYALFGQLLLLGPCINISVPLIKYRRHSGSVSIANHAAQMDLALQVSRFLARSFSAMKGLETFDPGPFCNHADYVFDFGLNDYSAEYSRMSDTLRKGLGQSRELDRELAFRWVLATRNSAAMAARFLEFQFKHSSTLIERRTVRNWLLRNLRNGKYVYRANVHMSGNGNAAESFTPNSRE